MSLRQHHESAEKGKSQSLVTLLGLDGKTISPVPYRRRGSISLDIPFYRTALLSTGNRGFPYAEKRTSQDFGEQGTLQTSGTATSLLILQSAP
jgi:hypothetical protein